MAFVCNGESVEVDAAPGETLLSVLRERVGLVSVKDGCAPQGQCGCCTVLVDGAPRVACVTPAERVAGRSVTTVEGLDPRVRSSLADAFVSTGGSQCGFCTPGIVVRAAALLEGGHPAAALDRALAAHLCRCTGWRTVSEAIEHARRSTASSPGPGPGGPIRRRDLDAAARRAELEGGLPQRVGPTVPLGDGGFADDTAPRDALVAVPAGAAAGAADGSVVEAVGVRWVVVESLWEARVQAAKVQGRRTTAGGRAPLPLRAVPDGGVRLATGWVEPAYLEPDASWCEPGGVPASPLANGGAFGAKSESLAPRVARELADRFGRPVRVVLSREDVVRLGPKRPPISATAVLEGSAVHVDGRVVGAVGPFERPIAWPYRLDERSTWAAVSVPGPATSPALRAVGLAERALLVEGALAAAGADRSDLIIDDRGRGALLDTCVTGPGGALAGARVALDPAGVLEHVEVRVGAGDPLDEIVLRSYCIGAAHMAMGWVLTEGLTVDPETGEVLDLTIRSFGVIRARDTPPIEVTILDDDGPPRAGASDAVFAAVAAATWNAVSAADGTRPETFPARGTRAARRLVR